MKATDAATRRAARRIAAAAVIIAAALGSTACTFERRLVEGAVEEAQEAPFYRVPDPLSAGDPGTLIRSEPIASAPDGSRAWRVLYHSTDVTGDPIAVSGVVVAPDTAAPAGGRAIVSWGHPTTGAAQRCAPSVGIDPFDTIEGLTDLIARGYVVVATDYSGMGAAGPDSYLVGETEGRNVLDAARSARALDTGANDRLVLWGHSQGGHAALFAALAAAEYAPELALEGVAVAAPAVDLGELLDADIGDVSGVTIASYAFSAYASVYGPSTPGATLDTILTPAAASVVPSMAELCLFGQNSELHESARPLIGEFLKSDPATTEPWSGLLAANTPTGTPVPAPLYVAQGVDDTLVRPELTEAFVAEQRALGAEVRAERIAGTGHALVAMRAMATLLPWLDEHAPASR